MSYERRGFSSKLARWIRDTSQVREPGAMPSSPVPNRLRVVVRPPGRTPYAIGLEQLTAHVRAYRVLRMGRLSKILDRARVAELNLETAVERDVAKYVERVAEVDRRREDTFMAKHASLDGHVSDLAEFKEDLEAFGKNERPGGERGSAYTGTGGDNG